MTDTTETPVTPVTTDAAAPARTRTPKADKGHFATLARGGKYVLMHAGKLFRFEGGVETRKPIPTEVKEHLERTALDPVTVTDGEEGASTEHRPKFTFRPAS